MKILNILFSSSWRLYFYIPLIVISFHLFFHFGIALNSTFSFIFYKVAVFGLFFILCINVFIRFLKKEWLRGFFQLICVMFITVVFLILGFMPISDYKSTTLLSPSESYNIQGTVNAAGFSRDIIVKIRLYDHNLNELDVITTGASDVMKWVIGWDSKEDIVILYSSDIGNRAWRVNNNSLMEIPYKDLSEDINNQATDLYNQKYKKTD